MSSNFWGRDFFLLLGVSFVFLLVQLVQPYTVRANTNPNNETGKSTITKITSQEAITNEVNWITSLQKQNGAVVMSPTYSIENINPYFANITLTALAKASDGEYTNEIKQYVDWYFTHLNMPDRFGLYGTVYDYQIDKMGRETTNKHYDSADSYAATFISLLRAYAESGGDLEYLRSHKYEIDIIGGVMIKLMDKDHLTWAKPNYKVKYLMDNSEVYKGLKDMVYIYEHVFKDKKGAQWYRIHATNVQKAILKHMRNGNEFYYAITSSSKMKANWSKWYPDSTAQLFPIAFEVISPKDPLSQKIYSTFNKSHTNWHHLKTSDSFPWVFVGYASSLMNDTVRVSTFSDQLHSKYIHNNRKWPWYNVESAWYILMNNQTLSSLNEW
ncbi:hypothetical protein ACLM5H_12770 [Fredinandcohnia humi]